MRRELCAQLKCCSISWLRDGSCEDGVADDGCNASHCRVLRTVYCLDRKYTQSKLKLLQHSGWSWSRCRCCIALRASAGGNLPLVGRRLTTSIWQRVVGTEPSFAQPAHRLLGDRYEQTKTGYADQFLSPISCSSQEATAINKHVQPHTGPSQGLHAQLPCSLCDAPLRLIMTHTPP